MIRHLVTVGLLLHHIEGVCKPWSAATLAARRIVTNLVEHAIGRDREAAAERAAQRQDAAIERAQEAAARAADRRSVADVRRRALGWQPVAPTWVEHVARQRRERP